MQTATSSSSTYGNTTVTSTSSSTTMHATENKKVTAENVEKTLTAGRPVASFPMNEEVFARYDIEKGSSPEALVENAPETPMVAEQPTKEEPEEKDLKAEADQTPKTEKEETKLEEQSI